METLIAFAIRVFLVDCYSSKKLTVSAMPARVVR